MLQILLFPMLFFAAVGGYLSGLDVAERRAKRAGIRACVDMANRYDADIEGCDSEELIAYTEAILCAYRLAYIIKYDQFPSSKFPLEMEFKSLAKELLDECPDEVGDNPFGGLPTSIQTCTRPAPHVCCENGPCNGFPREATTEESWQEKWSKEAEAEANGRSMLL